MPRRRSASPQPSRSASSSSRNAAPPPARAAAPVPAPVPPPAPAPQVVQEQPSMFKQMAATAGGVAVGSAVGHAVGSAVTGMFSGGSSSSPQAVTAAPVEAATPAPLASRPDPTGACAFEIKQFLKCADEHNNDLTLCEGFNEAIRQCKQANNLV